MALAFGVFGTIALLVHPLDWNVTFGHGNSEMQANLSIDPATARAQSAEQGLESLRSQSKAFVAIAKKVLPSVVSITSERTVQVAGLSGRDRNLRFFGDPFLERFFQAPERVPQQGAGSGVIVSPDGYVLTNNHVVADAERIKVTLEDGRSFDGELVGRDPKSDVAVVRIKPNGEKLQPIEMGNSDQLEVGEWVMAVGNPFQLSSTVTAGIVSAVGRSNIGLTDYEDFIQTDAAINPGNSGGALVNLDGRLVGINTAIASRNGGNMGVGFAIPINMASRIMDDLITHGKVTRGWLGVRIQNLNEDMAEIFHLDKPYGALIGSVENGSPAEKAGLEQGDLIVEMNGHEIKNTEDLRLQITAQSPGTTIDLKVIRDAKPKQISVKLGELESDQEVGPGFQGEKESESDLTEGLGLKIDELTSTVRQQLDLPAGIEGVVVDQVDPVSAAGRAGMQRGDVILKVGNDEIDSPQAFRRALRDVGPGKAALLLIRRGEAEIFLGVRIPEE